MNTPLAKHTNEAVSHNSSSHASSKSAFKANYGQTNAISSGIAKAPEAACAIAADKKLSEKLRAVGLFHHSPKPSGDDSDSGEQAANNIESQTCIAAQSDKNLREKIYESVLTEMDEAEETEGISSAQTKISYMKKAPTRSTQKAQSATNSNAGTNCPSTNSGKTTAVKKSTTLTVFDKKPVHSSNQINQQTQAQAKRLWLKARTSQQSTSSIALKTTAKKQGAKTLSAALSSVAAPFSGALLAILAFILAAIVVAQLTSALFGFWENEQSKENLEGLPPYITNEMIVTALECQETYGHPAGCTIAQIICESGQGDSLSALATQDNNLFGIKWSSSYSLSPEVSGYSSWETLEEYNGEYVSVIAQFTSFNSYEDCIVFRSRVFLQYSLYSENDLIKEAIASGSSDTMAEGLKDAGYATDSAYVETLKFLMSTYNLYQFDNMTVDQYNSITSTSETIIEAAFSQLGVPYIWGGSTPYVGLDCSGLTQYCYAQAGITIPRQSEDQKDGGTLILLSQAEPGDILWKYGHVAIFIGEDQYIHEPYAGEVCKIASGIDYFTCAVRYA